MIMKNILLFLGVSLSVVSYAQKLKFKVLGEKDTTVFLVKYYGKGMYYADTAEIKKGMVEFDGKKQKPGVLALLLPGQKYFDFLYNNEDVNIETQGPDFVKSMKINKSNENTIFVQYIKFMNEERGKAKELADKREKLQKSDPEYKRLTSEMEKVSKGVIAYQKNLVETYPSTLVSKIVKMSMDVDIPEIPRKADGSMVDSNFAYKYFRDHYFDNIDLNDDRLLSTPVFHNKLDFFFSNSMLVPNPDTITKYAFRFVDRLNPKSEMFKYCLTHITSSYEKSNIMGMDKVFVKMGERYYCVKNVDGSTNITWMDKEKLDDLCKKVNTYKNLVVGVVPPNISLVDTTDTKWHDFYSLKKDYVVLYFWDPECGHCKKTTPKLGELYTKKLKDRNVEVFAIGKAIGDDFDKWKKFVKENKLTFTNVAVTEKLYKAALENPLQFVPKYTTIEALNYQETYDIYSTPRIFVLDKDKKIIAKSLSISQLEDMLDHLQDKKDAPKLFPPDPEEEEHAKETH
jgi:thiol-disulfide isomerase/thioredoxin